MALPYDAWSVAAITCAALLLFAASRRQFSTAARLTFIVAAAFIIRLDPAWQLSLHIWDESVHAVVAKHLISHPLRPTLYDNPVLSAPADDWTLTEVWLHKPPLALWLMAASLSAFGIDALALRLPSLLLSTAGVLVTFLIGRRLYDARVALLAAALQAVNGLLVALSSGRRVADHVDTVLVACVQIGLLAAFSARDDRKAARAAWITGVALGLGILAKSMPAFLILAVAVVWWSGMFGMRRSLGLTGRALIAAAAVSLPWLVYTRLAFPEEARLAGEYTLRHITTVLEGHGGSIWFYLSAMPHYFGELIYLPAGWYVARAFRRHASPDERAIAAWIVVPVATFSLMATKLPGFIAIAAPALFLVQAVFWLRVREWFGRRRNLFARGGLVVVMTLLVALPARYLLEPTGAFERRDRHQTFTRQIMDLDAKFNATQAVVFNVPRPFEFMFYSRYQAYDRMPTPADIDTLRARGLAVVIYQPAGTRVTPPADWGAIVIDGK